MILGAASTAAAPALALTGALPTGNAPSRLAAGLQPQNQQTMQQTAQPQNILGALPPASTSPVTASPVPTVAPIQTASRPMNTTGAPPTGLIGSEQALTEGLGAITSGSGQARADITGVLNEFNDPNSFKNSAATEYLLGQSQKAIERSAAARGGLLGGNVLQELQRNAVGLASQDYNNQFSIKASLADRLAGIAENAGIQTAGLKATVGAGRYQAGRDIAQNATQAASQISNLLNQQGANISDITKNDISTITNMIYQSGLQNKIDAQQLATILANISGSQASQMSQGYQSLGASQAAGVMGIGNAVQNGIGQGIATGMLGAPAPYAAMPTRAGIPSSTTINTGAQYGGYA